LDDKSSKEQLVHYYKLISSLGLNRKSLFVWDCDAERDTRKLEENDMLFKYVIPNNPENTAATAGIENAFSTELLKPDCKKIIETDGSETYRFDNRHKKRFTEKISKSENNSDFKHFSALSAKVIEILNNEGV
jgi:hypothetical protein